nr:hypothetical protein [uncultured Draconibacterium sp.]
MTKKIKLLCLLIILVFPNLLAQTTKTLTLSSGEGWYRILEGTTRASGILRLSGTSGNNRATNITMEVSLMAYSQGGNINIINNLYYNSNHIKEIRGGSSNGKYVLDVYFEYITTPSNLNVETDGTNLTILDNPIFNPTDDLKGKVTTSGRVISIKSTRYPIYLANYVGIGTTNPSENLHVNGLIKIPTANSTDNNSPGIVCLSNDDFLYDGDYINHYGFGFHKYTQSTVQNGINTYVSGYFGIDLFTGGNNRLRIAKDGNVLVGKTYQINSKYKLDVAGSIRANEIKVNLDGADFVFEPDYRLKPLNEVESYIKENKRLPEIASADEMNKEGADLGELNTKLLQKIEELTLYMIEMNKEVKALKNENSKLMGKVKKLEAVQ